MTRHLVFLGILASTLAGPRLLGQPPAAKTYLLNVGEGNIPTDTGTEATKVVIEAHKQLGGKALMVVLADSFGDQSARVKNWRPFTTLAFNAVNPGDGAIKVNLNIKHQKTTNYATRVDIPITLKPGRNEVRLKIAAMTNTNGTAADLGNIVRWYLATDKKPVTLYFSDFWFEGGSTQPIVGTAKVGSDPARLARLRAAKMPTIDKVVMFDTPEADAICSALEVYPADNAWNLVVEDWPLHSKSKDMIERIGANKPFRYNPDMGFVLVPPDQKKINVKIVGYPGESDKGPFPVPDNTPIEGWPAHYQSSAKLKQLTLDDVQRDKLKQGGDRHAIVVDPTNRMLYEFFVMKKSDAGWQAAQSSIFDLKSNKLRPDGWTSADAAGLPIFPAVVRYDELKRGIVEHAMRVTFVKTRRAYVHPATHFASKLTDDNLPRMGERFRLRKDFNVKGFTPEVQAILKGLQKYGMFCADNGIDWAISVAPDPRIPVLHLELRKLKGSDFDVVVPPGN